MAVNSTSRRSRAWQYVGLLALLIAAAMLISLALRNESDRVSSRVFASVTPAPTQPTTVFLGDSSVFGAGASKADARWSTRVSKVVGWKEVNLARAGSGYAPTDAKGGCDGAARCTVYAKSVAEVLKAKPRVVVVGGGQAGTGVSTVETSASVRKLYRSLRAGLPQATIIAVGPWSAAITPNKATLLLDRSVQNSATQVRAHYVSLLLPRVVDETMITRAGTLNDAGHLAVADQVVTQLDGDS